MGLIYVNERIDGGVTTRGGPFTTKASAHSFIRIYQAALSPGIYPILYTSQRPTKEYKDGER